MSDESRPPATDSTTPGARRARLGRKHTIGRVIIASLAVLGLVSGLGMVYLFRHLNGNITGVSLGALGDDRPEKVYKGNGEPLNVLVMGSDSRDCEGCGVDNEGGGGSDTTILVHISADRDRAYAVSIPRDSVIDRPACGNDDEIPAESEALWNAAYNVGGPVCTMEQVEATTNVFVDHFVVVDFNGFGDMVDAVGGVPVCVPEDIDDPKHEIFVPAGDPSVLSGDQALDYVRARYVGELIQQNDISRIRRQQTFIAALVREVKSTGTLTRLDKVVNFLDAATKSLTTDTGLDSVTRIGKLAMQLQSIGLDNVKFVTLPTEYYPKDSEHSGKVFWTPEAAQIWKLLNEDKPLPPKLLSNSISAEPPATSEESETPDATPSNTPSSPTQTASPSQTAEPETPKPEPVPGVCA